MPKEAAHQLDPFTELVTTQKLQHEEVMKEIAAVKSDVKDVKDGQALQLARMETRLLALETFRERNQIDAKIKQWDEAYQSYAFQRKVRWLIWSTVGAAAGVVGFVVQETVYYIINRH